MFPICDHNPAARTPYVTWSLIVINCLVFLFTYQALGDPAASEALFAQWALLPADVSTGAKYSGLITSQFLHAGLLHLGGNMLFLHIFGDNLEEEFGHIGFLIFYLACGIAAGGAQIYPDPNSTVPMIGASGAIAGVMGGYMLLFPRARVDVLLFILFYIRVFTIRAFIVLGIWFALQLLSEFTSHADTGVAYMAHIGGFVAGFVLCLWPWISRRGPEFWRQTDGHPPHPEAKFPRYLDPPHKRRGPWG